MRSQLNIRIDDARKLRWFRAAQAHGLDLTAWIKLVCDDAALATEKQGTLFPMPPERPAEGAYSR